MEVSRGLCGGARRFVRRFTQRFAYRFFNPSDLIGCGGDHYPIRIYTEVHGGLRRGARRFALRCAEVCI